MGQRQALSLTGPSSFAFTPPACRNHASATLPEPQSPAPSGAASPTGAASRMREPHRPRQRQSPASTATTSTITQALRGAVESALKCLYLAIISLDPTGKGRQRWTNRWKAALNAFDITFDGRLSAGRK